MIDDAAEPRSTRDAALQTIEKEDLDLCGVEELKERIARLEREIDRTRQGLDKKQSGRSAADALFKF